MLCSALNLFGDLCYIDFYIAEMALEGFGRMMFPRWFVLFTPIVTMAWVAVGFLVLPDPWGMYFAGAFGTWILFVMNLASCAILWNVDEAVVSFRELRDEK